MVLKESGHSTSIDKTPQKCPVDHSGQSERSLHPHYYFGPWQILKSEEGKTTFYRKTDQGVARQEIDFSNLVCTPRFRVALETWAVLCMAYGTRSDGADGPQQIQMIIDEFVLMRSQLQTAEPFADLSETFRLLLKDKSNQAEIIFEGIRFQYVLRHLGLPPRFFAILEVAKDISAEEFTLFCESLVSLNKRVHLSLHALAQGVVKQLVEDQVPFKKVISPQDLSSVKLMILGEEFEVGINPALTDSPALQIITQYWESLGKTAIKILDLTHQTDWVNVLQKIIKTLDDELNTGINFLTELGLGTTHQSMNDLTSIRDYTPSDGGKLVNEEDDDDWEEALGLRISSGITVHSSCVLPENKKAHNAGFFHSPHHISELQLPLSGKTVQIQNNVAHCPHPYMAKMKTSE
jgi:hypothetical protein